MSAAPFTLRFTEWRCGHHGQRPADIPVHTVEQAQLVVQAIGYAISQPGHARAALFDDTTGVSVYLTDDYAETIPTGWPRRTVVFHGTEAEIAELHSLGAEFDYVYGGTLESWDGKKYLDGLEVVTTLTVPEIEAAIAPVDWIEEDRRHPVCEVPPVLTPAAELLAELRQAAAEMAGDDAEVEGGAA
jgi:hypothetical protein